MLEPPIDTQPHYGEHLGDRDYWSPYVIEVLRREGLPVAEVEPPFVGSFPTFLVGDHVVKLFGSGFDGAAACAAEHAMHELLAGHAEIPVPELVAAGEVFPTESWAWPYLVTRRLRGDPVRERPLAGGGGLRIAEQLGHAVSVLHALDPPAEVTRRDLIQQLRSEAPERLARFGLPAHLVEQVPDLLADAPEPDTLVHADITADHLFHNGTTITGIIDWGDAIVADPFYELVAVAFDALVTDGTLFNEFLHGYGWHRDDQFSRQALRAVCEFQFNAITTIATLIDLESVRSLDELAERLFAPLRG